MRLPRVGFILPPDYDGQSDTLSLNDLKPVMASWGNKIILKRRK